MRTRTVIGLRLVLLGGLALAVGGITYTEAEHSADLGPFEFLVKDEERVPIPPLFSGLVLLSGVGLIAYSALSGRGHAG